jgi:hypothetical protein
MADFSKRYTLKGLEDARIASTFDDLELNPKDRRALNIIKMVLLCHHHWMKN